MSQFYIAYKGEKFVLEWYFDDRGNSQPRDYFEELNHDHQKKVLHLFKLLGERGRIFNEEKFRYEHDQIYAFKIDEHRFLSFFFAGAKVIITNAFEKKADKMPQREKERALKAKNEFKLRNDKGSYYGEKN